MGRSLIEGFFSITSARIGRMLLYVALTPLIVRILGPSYGDYAFIISVSAMIMVISGGGVFTATRKYIPERRDSQWEGNVFWFYVIVSTVFVIIVGLTAAILLLTGVIERLGEPFVLYTILLVLMVAAKSYMNVARSALMAFKLERISEPLFALQMLLLGVVGVTLAYVGWSVVGLLVGHIVSTGLVLAVMLVILNRKISFGRIFVPRASSFPARELLSFSGLSVVLFLLMESLYHVDILFIRLLVGQEATAHYKAALLTAEFLWLVPIALQTLLLHSSSELWANEQYERIQTLSAMVTRYNLLLTALLGVGIAVLAEEFVGLYFGPGFDAAVVPVLILLPGALGFALARGVFSFGHGKGELKLLIQATAGAAVLNLILNAILIPSFGILGAATATTAGYGSMFLFHIIAAREIGFDPIADLRIAPIAATTLITGIVIYVLNGAITSSILALLVVPSVGLVVFSILAIMTGALDIEEVRYMTNGFVKSLAPT